MNKKLSLSGLLFVFSLVAVCAQPRAGYYDAAQGKSDAALKTALFTIIKNLDVVSYAELWNSFRTTDNLDGEVWDMYSDCSFSFGKQTDGGNQCGSSIGGLCSCYNREHSFPKSWFGGDVSPMYSDLFHLYPTDGYVNGIRGNNPFGEVGSNYQTHGTGKSGSGSSESGYTGTVFEPADEYKGDFARTYFYMITCYENRVSNWSSPMLSGNGYTEWATNLLLKWHRQDAVSTKETNRNNAVENIQDNRNPFIDHPELVEYIWGNRKGEIWGAATGCDEFAIDFVIVQNPVRDEIEIQSAENNLQYMIYSINGQVLKSGAVNGNIRVDDVSNGLYLLQLQAEGRKSVRKVIVNR